MVFSGYVLPLREGGRRREKEKEGAGERVREKERQRERDGLTGRKAHKLVLVFFLIRTLILSD